MEATKLFKFSFETLRSFANNPTSEKFIPLVLHEAGEITPITVDKFEIGVLKNEAGDTISGAIAASYGTSKGGTSTPDPEKTYPVVNLEDITNHSQKVIVDGLNNVVVQDFLSYNYDSSNAKITVVVPLIFNQWSVNAGKVTHILTGNSYTSPLQEKQLTNLKITSPFHIVQSLLYYPGGNEIEENAKKKTATLNGTFSFNIPSLIVQSTVEITVTESNGYRTGIAMNITKLDLVTPSKMKFSNVLVKGNEETHQIYQEVLIPIIEESINSIEGTQGILSGLTAALNSGSNLANLNNLLNERFNNIVNDKLGAVTNPASIGSYDGPGGGNQVDYYMFDRIRYALDTEGSPWYIKTLLENYRNPVLNPFKPENLNIGSFTFSFSGIDFTLENITLSDIEVTGLPNSSISKGSMKLGPPLYIRMVLAGTVATANFSANYPGGTLELGVSVTINNCEIAATINASGPSTDDLSITVEAISFEIPETKDLILTLDDQDGFAPIVQNMLNTATVQDKIKSAVNDAFKKHLTAISLELTKIAKDTFSKAIG